MGKDKAVLAALTEGLEKYGQRFSPTNDTVGGIPANELATAALGAIRPVMQDKALHFRRRAQVAEGELDRLWAVVDEVLVDVNCGVNPQIALNKLRGLRARRSA
ncbi:MAG TPA: hypothetical protein VJ742_13085 [Nitrososphaera sp.]|nr:hypothetical protein [Nitrososphaera sp.]